MPLDVLGCTRATLTGATSFFVGAWCVGLVSSCCAFSCSGVELGTLLNTRRAGDRCLQLFILNEEFLVSAIHQIALITSLPFVHTARRYYRLNGLVRPRDWRAWRWQQLPLARREPGQTWLFRGSKSRNKAVVGEPATGSLPLKHLFACCFVCLVVVWGVCVFFTHSLTAAANEQQQQQKIGLVSTHRHLFVCVGAANILCNGKRVHLN